MKKLNIGIDFFKTMYNNLRDAEISNENQEQITKFCNVLFGNGGNNLKLILNNIHCFNNDDIESIRNILLISFKDKHELQQYLIEQKKHSGNENLIKNILSTVVVMDITEYRYVYHDIYEIGKMKIG